MNTITQIRSALQDRKGDWPKICETTGLSYWWLTKFAQGRIREPGLSKIERLQVYISANPLEPAANDDTYADPDSPAPAQDNGAGGEGA